MTKRQFCPIEKDDGGQPRPGTAPARAAVIKAVLCRELAPRGSRAEFGAQVVRER